MDSQSSFQLVNNLNSTRKDGKRVADLDLCIVSTCDQLVVGPIHVNGGTLDLLMIHAPGLVSMKMLLNCVHPTLISALCHIQTALVAPSSNPFSFYIRYFYFLHTY